MSSIIASSRPPADVSTPATSRGVLSSRSRPIAWASRRAGSMVSTTTRRPCSAARRPRAAATVVLPTPPAPQHTTIRAAGSARSASTSSGALARRPGLTKHPPADGPASCSRHPLLAQLLGQSVERAQVDAGRDGGQLVHGPPERLNPHPLALLEREPGGVLARLVQQALHHGRRRVEAGRGEAVGHLVGVQPALAGRSEPA